VVAWLVAIGLLAACSGGAASSAPASSGAPSLADGTSCTLEAPDSATAGSTVDVAWTGASGQDYIAIVARGAKSFDDTLPYTDVKDGNPAKVAVPAAAGEYDVVCFQGDTVSLILGRRPITVE
jgi:Ca-activated chloride channel homolog